MWKLSSRRSKTEAAGAPSQAAAIAAASPAREVIYRHALAVRLTHWINALCLALLLMSGLQILNYHPALYWGNYGYRGVPSVASIGSEYIRPWLWSRLAMPTFRWLTAASHR